MVNFSEVISAILSKLAQLLGIKPSESQRLELMESKLGEAKATNVDRLEDLKREIRALEARALQKKREWVQAKGESRRIIAGEIERTFRDLDRLHGRERIISSNIDKLSLALSKIKELSVARAQGVEEGQLDELAVELQDVFADLKASDRAAKDLEQEKYEPLETSHIDVEERIAEVEGHKEAPSGLSEKTLRRLKQLEGEEA